MGLCPYWRQLTCGKHEQRLQFLHDVVESTQCFGAEVPEKLIAFGSRRGEQATAHRQGAPCPRQTRAHLAERKTSPW